MQLFRPGLNTIARQALSGLVLVSALLPFHGARVAWSSMTVGDGHIREQDVPHEHRMTAGRAAGNALAVWILGNGHNPFDCYRWRAMGFPTPCAT